MSDYSCVLKLPINHIPMKYFSVWHQQARLCFMANFDQFLTNDHFSDDGHADDGSFQIDSAFFFSLQTQLIKVVKPKAKLSSYREDAASSYHHNKLEAL